MPLLPAPLSRTLLLPASASTVGGNECLEVLVPARLSSPFLLVYGESPPPRAIRQILTLCERERDLSSPGGSFVYAKVTRGEKEGLGGGGSSFEVIYNALSRPRGPPRLAFE